MLGTGKGSYAMDLPNFNSTIKALEVKGLILRFRDMRCDLSASSTPYAFCG